MADVVEQKDEEGVVENNDNNANAVIERDDSMNEFLDELDKATDEAIDQAQKDAAAAAKKAVADSATTTTMTPLEGTGDNNNNNEGGAGDISESPTKMATRKSRPTPVQVAASRVDNNNTPSSNGGGGMTMYERSKLQMEQRELKLKALQQQMMADCTFTPRGYNLGWLKAGFPWELKFEATAATTAPQVESGITGSFVDSLTGAGLELIRVVFPAP